MPLKQQNNVCSLHPKFERPDFERRFLSEFRRQTSPVFWHPYFSFPLYVQFLAFACCQTSHLIKFWLKIKKYILITNLIKSKWKRVKYLCIQLITYLVVSFMLLILNMLLRHFSPDICAVGPRCFKPLAKWLILVEVWEHLRLRPSPAHRPNSRMMIYSGVEGLAR